MGVVCVCEQKCQKCLNNCIPFQAIKQNGAGGSSSPLEKIHCKSTGGVGSRTVKEVSFQYVTTDNLIHMEPSRKD